MSDARNDELIAALGQDLEPVRPIPRIRSAALAVLLTWLAVAAAGVLARGLAPGIVEETLAHRGVSAIYAVLLVGALGGLVAALALGVPGRERLAALGLGLGAAGLAAAAGIGTLLVLNSPAGDPLTLSARDLQCLGAAFGVALIPALGILWYVGRGSPHRPLAAVVAAAAATTALGAVTAQASCPYGDLSHLLMGHVLAPAFGALLLTAPLLAALRRLARS